ncbi:universal stress protein [Variovorax sp. J22R133]|uniref:universal stress protein n=1 Tax=Variovorax brevis TaxID=3053503 RepID=UPI0025765E47|nr:universal stress protein [Variovorax sp. J22R133]MDM0117712.1 universal stress protein [Variovorax sp. J22R133]
MKILLAVDGSEYTRRMLSFVTTHKDWFGEASHCTVFYGVLAVPHRAAAFAGPDLVHAYYNDDATAVLDPVRDFLAGHGIEAKYVHEVGHPAAAIAKLAEDGQFDLVVVGSHGHGAFRNLVLGSVATKVLASCSVPVLVVR